MAGRRSLGRTWGFDRGSESPLLSTIAFLFITSIHIKQHAEFTDIGFAWYVVAAMVIKRGRGALLFWDARYDGDFIGCVFQLVGCYIKPLIITLWFWLVRLF